VEKVSLVVLGSGLAVLIQSNVRLGLVLLAVSAVLYLGWLLTSHASRVRVTRIWYRLRPSLPADMGRSVGVAPANGDPPTQLTFARWTTDGKGAFEMRTTNPRFPTAVLFRRPERRRLTKQELPAMLDGYRGELTVRRFTFGGLVVDDNGVKGELVEAEFYFDDLLGQT
jgi:hypothetical protein